MLKRLIWTIFNPGDLVYCPKEQLLYKLVRSYIHKEFMNLGPSKFVLIGRCVRWDGEKFGYSTAQIFIFEFEGTKAITDLIAYPIGYHPSPEDLKQSFKTRGEKFFSLRGIHHKAYRGEGIQHKKYLGMWDFSDPRNVSGLQSISLIVKPI